MINDCLADLENRIDPDVEAQLQAEWEAFTKGDFTGNVFSPRRNKQCPPLIAWPNVTTNQAQVDEEAMLLQQYGGCSSLLAGGGGGLMTIRANYGTGIIPSLFGAELFVMDESHDTLQTTRPLGVGAIAKLIEQGVPNVEAGLGKAVLETGRQFAEIASRYPKIGKYVHIYHPDMQGPMDVCEMLWGSELFIDLVDNPERVHRLLDVITETYIVFMKAWDAAVGYADTDKEWTAHWGMMQKGRIMLRTDSGVNLSPDMYDAFIRPYDQRLLHELGGGAVHFCGRGSHYIASACAMEKLYAINLSQPHLNDMETIYRNTVDKGIKLLGFHREYAEKALHAGRNLHSSVHCPA